MAIEYKGVNLAGLEFGNGNRVNVDYVLPGKAHYDYWAQDVGSNIIRLPFMWERLQPQLGGGLNQEYLSYLKSSVQWAKQNDMTLVLDLHNYARHNGSVVNASQLTDVWKKIHAAIGNDDNVWLNLMNEPYNVSATSWANTTQQVVNNLRAAGVENKLLLSGTAWSGAHSWVSSGNAAAYQSFTDPRDNYAFDVHQYLDSDSSGTSATAVQGAGATRLIAVTQWAEAGGHQLFLGEAGLANNAASRTEMTNMIKYMEAHGDAWLGFTLWGAGPWWPSNYIFYINPSNLGGNEVHANSIAALLPLLKPDDVPDNPGPDPDPDPAAITASLTTRADTVKGTDGDDVVETWMGQLGAEDKVALGKGHDVLKILNTGMTLDTALLKNFSGVDGIDITASTGKANILLTEDFVKQSDNNKITITYGKAGYGKILTDAPSHYKIEEGAGKVTVTYQGPQGPGTDPVPGIERNATTKDDAIVGSSGDDVIKAYGTQMNPGDSLKLGGGFDTVKILSNFFDFDGSQFSKWSGVDQLDMSGTRSGNHVRLDRAIIDQSDNDSFTILFGDAKLGSLDVSGLARGTYTMEWTDDSVTVSLVKPSSLFMAAGDMLDSLPGSGDGLDLSLLFEANGIGSRIAEGAGEISAAAAPADIPVVVIDSGEMAAAQLTLVDLDDRADDGGLAAHGATALIV